MKYCVEFQDIVSQRPQNIIYKIDGEKNIYYSLQELQKNLNGVVSKNSRKRIIIKWEWPYESGKNISAILKNDQIDTKCGKDLSSYKFKIVVTGEEVI